MTMIETIQPVVYVVQDRTRTFDISSAAEYGRLELVLNHGEQMYDMDATIRRVFSKLHRFSDHDYILAIGHPIAIGLCLAVAARVNGGRFKTLIWDKELNRYYSAQTDLSDIPINEEVRV